MSVAPEIRSSLITMATLTVEQVRAHVAELFISYLGRAPEFQAMNHYVGLFNQFLAKQGTAAAAQSNAFKALSTQIYNDAGGASEIPTGAAVSDGEYVDWIYKNVLGRAADDGGKAFWVLQLTNGFATRADVVAQVVAAAKGDGKGAGRDAKYLENRTKVALEFAKFENSNPNVLKSLKFDGKQVLAGVDEKPESVTTAQDKVSVASNAAQTFALTKGLDNVQGGAGNDTIIGSLDASLPELNTLSSLDIVNGGTGIDTLKIATVGGSIALPNVSNVEVVVVESAGEATVDTSAVNGIETLSIQKAGANVNATAAASTDILVAVKEMNASVAQPHRVNGGKNVTVNVADAGSASASAADTVSVGATTAAKGDVVVNVTGKASDANAFFGSVTVKGGATISVTQKTASNASTATNTSKSTVTQGNVSITADAATTAITVKQEAAVEAKNASYKTGGVTESASVKFGALKKGDSLASNGLTFTAKVDMTGAEVATAFAGLLGGPANVASGKDTQSAALASKGTYTGAFETGGFTSAAANGDTVVFTSVKANENIANDLAFVLTNTSGSSVAPTVAVTQGKAHDAAPAGGVAGVVAGSVTIGGDSASGVKTISVDGYSLSGSASSAATSGLTTLNLSNGGSFMVGTAAETLSVNLKGIAGDTSAKPQVAVLDLDSAATATLNVKSDGDNIVGLDLAGAAKLTALNISGSGILDASKETALGNVQTIKVTEAASLNLGTTPTTKVTTVDTTGTTGKVTVAIDGGQAAYTGGAGQDVVTILNSQQAIAKAVDLGAGDDTLVLNVVSGSTVSPTVSLKGGEGIDTLALTAESAAALSADGTFAGKIEGFEKLQISGSVSLPRTVNLSNLDAINYVVAGNAQGLLAKAQAFSFDIAGLELNSGGTLKFGEQTVYTAGASGAAAASIVAALPANVLISGVWYAVGKTGTAITLTSRLNVDSQPSLVVSATGEKAPITNTNVTSTPGQAANASHLTIDNLANNGTVELTADGIGAKVNVTNAGSGTADVLNIVANAAGDLGDVVAAGVETFNINVVDVDTSAKGVSTAVLTIAGGNANAIHVTGEGNLVLDVAGHQPQLAVVDAGKSKGSLTVDLNLHNGVAVSVTGGAGNDDLTASARGTGKADVLVGGEGSDTLVAGSNGAKLTGGAGNDVFVLRMGNKEVNTYSSVQDFKSGDLLKLETFHGVEAGKPAVAVDKFEKLAAVLNENTAVFSNFADAAIQQAALGDAVWFSFKGNAYVVIDNGSDASAYENGWDSIIELVGVNLDNASFNSAYGTVGLI